MDEIIIDKMEWSSPEYKHQEKSADFIWTIIVVSIVVFVLAAWFKNYLFAIFALVAGASLVLFSIKHPEEIHYAIETNGITIGKEKYEWKKIKGFDVKKYEDYGILLVELDKYFLPVYSIPIPLENVSEIKESLSKVTKKLDLEESKSMKFAEKIGF